MASYLIRRLALLPFVALGVTLLLFAILQLLSPEMRASLYVKDPRQLADLESIIEPAETEQRHRRDGTRRSWR